MAGLCQLDLILCKICLSYPQKGLHKLDRVMKYLWMSRQAIATYCFIKLLFLAFCRSKINWYIRSQCSFEIWALSTRILVLYHVLFPCCNDMGAGVDPGDFLTNFLVNLELLCAREKF